ncbi:MAG: hypothetical protein Q9186_006699 [Xanthomendoza sp. 1 TL-2023]
MLDSVKYSPDLRSFNWKTYLESLGLITSMYAYGAFLSTIPVPQSPAPAVESKSSTSSGRPHARHKRAPVPVPSVISSGTFLTASSSHEQERRPTAQRLQQQEITIPVSQPPAPAAESKSSAFSRRSHTRHKRAPVSMPSVLLNQPGIESRDPVKRWNDHSSTPAVGIDELSPVRAFKSMDVNGTNYQAFVPKHWSPPTNLSIRDPDLRGTARDEPIGHEPTSQLGRKRPISRAEPNTWYFTARGSYSIQASNAAIDSGIAQECKEISGSPNVDTQLDSILANDTLPSVSPTSSESGKTTTSSIVDRNLDSILEYYSTVSLADHV